MSRSKLAIYWAIALVLLLTTWWVTSRDQTEQAKLTELQLGDTLLPDIDGNSITSITLTSPAETVNLVQKGQTWTVTERDGYPAQNKPIFSGLRQLANLTVVQAVETSPDQWGRFGLDPAQWPTPAEGSATEKGSPFRLTLKNSSGDVAGELIIGNATSIGGAGSVGGRFVRRTGDDSGVYIVDDPFSVWSFYPGYWIDPGLIRLASPMRIEFSAPNEPQVRPWVLQRNSLQDILRLKDKKVTERLNPDAIAPLGSLFQPLTVREVFSETQTQKVYDRSKERIIVIDTSHGVRMTLRIAPTGEIRPGRDPDLYLMKVAFEKSPLYNSDKAEAALERMKPAHGKVFIVGRVALSPVNRPRRSFFEKPREINPGQR